jgi:hypothetical protein
VDVREVRSRAKRVTGARQREVGEPLLQDLGRTLAILDRLGLPISSCPEARRGHPDRRFFRRYAADLPLLKVRSRQASSAAIVNRLHSTGACEREATTLG